MKKISLVCAAALCAGLAGCASTAPSDGPARAAVDNSEHDLGTVRHEVASGPDIAAAVERLMREPLDVVKAPASLRYIDAAARRGHVVRAYRFADGAALTGRDLAEIRQIIGENAANPPLASTYQPMLVEFDAQGRVVSFLLHGLTAHEHPTAGVMLFWSVLSGPRAVEVMTSMLPRLSSSDVLTDVALLLPEE